MTRRFAVIGDPVAQSLSPKIHTYWYRRHGIDAAYDAVAIPAGMLRDGVARLADQGYEGWNVTIPHKVTMMELCDGLDAAAQAVQAVNTVHVRNGKMTGSNTDAVGAMTHLDQSCPGWASDCRVPLIIGAGGAARAIAYGLRLRGLGAVTVASRTEPEAQAFPGITWVPWAARQAAVSRADLIIQTTPLGMAGQPPLDISLKEIGKNAIIYDIVYKPLETGLIAQAREQDLRAVTGLGMLLHQARAAFGLWFGIEPAVDDALMREIGF